MAQPETAPSLPAINLSGNESRQKLQDDSLYHRESIKSEDPTHASWPQSKERALVRKIDWKLLPILCLIYLMAFLDRVNIGNAVIYGLQKDLKLVGNQYNAALTVFFVPYIIFEIPSNIILRRMKPHFWLPLCMFFFGLVMTLQGLVHSYSGLIATRFFLGLTEAGIFPGCFYLISMWYKRTEAQKRFALFFTSTQLAGAFGGLLATAIGKMNNIRGYHAWRWIFILEGILTCVVAFAAYFIVPDFPEHSSWLSADELAFIEARLATEQEVTPNDTTATLSSILVVLKDPKVLLGGLIYFALIVPAYGFAYFAPTVIETYHYTAIQTQLHSVPPSAAAFFFALLTATISDATAHRFLFAFLPTLLALAGTATLFTIHHDTHTEYAALFLVAMGTYTAMPIVICWVAMNLRGHMQRSVGIAWTIGFGNCGGIVATFAFLARDAPEYRTGYAVLLGFLALAAVTQAGYAGLVWSGERQKWSRVEENADGGSDDKGTWRAML